MPLILAVEPDRRQASHLAAVLRRRPRTELVIAESATRALDTLAARVPDVLLTSPLLSPQDETALADWLRSLGPAAARVQALTIPILATAKPAPRPRGVMSVLRRRRADRSIPDGCEPDVFADQVDVYLERTSIEREMDADPDPMPMVGMATGPEPALPAPVLLEPVVPERAVPEPAMAALAVSEPTAPEAVVVEPPALEPAPPEPVLELGSEAIAAAAVFVDPGDVYLEGTSSERGEADLDPTPIAAVAAVCEPAPVVVEPVAPELVALEPAVLEPVMLEPVMLAVATPEAAIPAQAYVEPPTVEPAPPEPVLETAPEVIVSEAAEAPAAPDPAPALVVEASHGLAARLRGALSAIRRQFPTVSTPQAGDSTVMPEAAAMRPARPDLTVSEPVPLLAAPAGDRADDVRSAPVATVADDDATWISLSLEELEDVPARLATAHDGPPATEDVWILGPIQEVEELFVPPAPLPVPLPEPFVNAVAAQPVEDVAPPTPLPKVAKADTPAPQPAPRKNAAKAKKPKPIQDEWGFFDPDQCGFAALLDKLDEITDEEIAAEKRDDTTVRVVAY